MSEKNYLAGYLNTILKSLINPTNHTYINIMGACWSKKITTSEYLVAEVFKDIDLSNASIILTNKYKSHTSNYTAQALKTKTNAHSIYQKEFESDHSKEVLIYCEKELSFYMIGSSNFSKPTYTLSDGKTNQSDIAFIFNNSHTRGLIKQIISTDNNKIMLDYWAQQLNVNLENENPNDLTTYKDYVKELKAPIITTPYIGNIDSVYSENLKRHLNTNPTNTQNIPSFLNIKKKPK